MAMPFAGSLVLLDGKAPRPSFRQTTDGINFFDTANVYSTGSSED